MAKIIQSTDEFNTILAQDKTVLLDFYADWCGPCQMQLPVVDQLSEKYADQLEVLKIDVDKYPGLAQAYGVRSIPALFLVRDQAIQDKMVGYQSATVLEGKFKQLQLIAN
ncbi:MAG: thioredoxin [Lewinella sp.]|uniref:thioredoxin n=1 Tax=Lewinella sp. TaxID=2004506 RepID=UPI003D6B98A9